MMRRADHRARLTDGDTVSVTRGARTCASYSEEHRSNPAWCPVTAVGREQLHPMLRCPRDLPDTPARRHRGCRRLSLLDPGRVPRDARRTDRARLRAEARPRVRDRGFFHPAPRAAQLPHPREARGFSERHAAALLAFIVAASAAIAFLTTPQIGFGEGQLGRGYGHDGVFYGRMTEHFAWFQYPVPGWQFAYRPLAPMLVHYTGLDTFTGFRVLNLASHAL